MMIYLLSIACFARVPSLTDTIANRDTLLKVYQVANLSTNSPPPTFPPSPHAHADQHHHPFWPHSTPPTNNVNAAIASMTRRGEGCGSGDGGGGPAPNPTNDGGAGPDTPPGNRSRRATVFENADENGSLYSYDEGPTGMLDSTVWENSAEDVVPSPNHANVFEDAFSANSSNGGGSSNGNVKPTLSRRSNADVDAAATAVAMAANIQHQREALRLVVPPATTPVASGALAEKEREMGVGVGGAAGKGGGSHAQRQASWGAGKVELEWSKTHNGFGFTLRSDGYAAGRAAGKAKIVATVYKGGPADLATVKSGDRIHRINGHDAGTFSHAQVRCTVLMTDLFCCCLLFGAI
jgi:hypothetical protein